MKKLLSLLFLLLFCLGCDEVQNKSKKINAISFHYDKIDIIGFQVFIRKDMQGYSQIKEAIQLLTHDLIELKHLVSPTHFTFFQKVNIWVEWNSNSPKAVHYIPSSLAWIKRNNYLPEKQQGIEILNIKNYIQFSCLQPYMLLHEFAHAYHHQVIGYENCLILDTYWNVIEKKLYDSVAYIKPFKKWKKTRAYAAHDAKEYFAELTESYFGLNDYFPFNKTDLQTFDPQGFQMMEKFWGK